MSVSEPGKIITPWAESGLKNPIPPAANPATGRAGFDQGFSAINMTAKEAGGIPPFGQDFNGIFYSITEILRYYQAGGRPTYSSELATATGGYAMGAVVMSDDFLTVYRNTVANNTTNPNTGGAGWVNEQATETLLGKLKVATQSQTNAGTDDATAVTPKKMRAGFSISLAANGYLAFPTWLGGLVVQWGVVSSPASYTANTAVSFTYPIAFPTAAFRVIGSNLGVTLETPGTQISSNSATGGQVVWGVSRASAGSLAISYIAIGN